MADGPVNRVEALGLIRQRSRRAVYVSGWKEKEKWLVVTKPFSQPQNHPSGKKTKQKDTAVGESKG